MAATDISGINRSEMLGVKTIQPEPQRYELKAPERNSLVLRDHYRRNVSAVGRALKSELEKLEAERSKFVSKIPETLVMADRETPRENYLFLRGDYRQRGADVAIDSPSALPPMDPALPKNRLGLARWLTTGTHPLTGRVAVNRMWQSFFGVGFVETPGDFGIRAELPSHADLLDWMAVEFVESGWDVQAMQRRIVLSATYRQSADSSPSKFAADPANRMMARGPRVRLSAEMVRDNALAVAGLLIEEVGGPSVKPYQAAGIWSEIFGGRDWRKDSGEAQYRRGLYVYWKRRAPYPSMATFDAQKGEVCTVTRPDTNTPLQALVLLNNPVYVEAARAFAQRMLTEDGPEDSKVEPLGKSSRKEGRGAGDRGRRRAKEAPAVDVQDEVAAVVSKAEDAPPTTSPEDDARIARAFRMCTSRNATSAEMEVLKALLVSQRAAYAGDAEGAAALIKIGDAPGLQEGSSITPQELAAWTALMSALINLDATIHKG